MGSETCSGGPAPLVSVSTSGSAAEAEQGCIDDTRDFTQQLAIEAKTLPSDKRRITAWAKRIAQWADQGMQELYFFIH